jgi:sugar phosphate isomerase/epimerase
MYQSRKGAETPEIQAVPRVPNARDDLAELRRRHVVASAAAGGEAALLADSATGIDCGRAAGLSRFTRTIEMIAELARDRGVGPAIEAPNHGTLASTLDETLSLLELVDMTDNLLATAPAPVTAGRTTATTSKR